MNFFTFFFSENEVFWRKNIRSDNNRPTNNRPGDVLVETDGEKMKKWIFQKKKIIFKWLFFVTFEHFPFWQRALLLFRPSAKPRGIGNCDIWADWKISFMNKKKWNEIQPRLKVWVQQIFQNLPLNFGKSHNESCKKNVYFCMA